MICGNGGAGICHIDPYESDYQVLQDPSSPVLQFPEVGMSPGEEVAIHVIGRSSCTSPWAAYLSSAVTSPVFARTSLKLSASKVAAYSS